MALQVFVSDGDIVTYLNVGEKITKKISLAETDKAKEGVQSVQTLSTLVRRVVPETNLLRLPIDVRKKCNTGSRFYTDIYT